MVGSSLLPIFALVLALGLTLAPSVLAESPSNETVVAATAKLSNERAKAELQLIETQRLRNAEVSATPDLSSADSSRKGDRQRLLDRLAFLQAERVKRLDELVALRKGPPVSISLLPVVQALGGASPFSAVAVDALRDELDGKKDRLAALDYGLAVRESEKQLLVDQLRRAEEASRLANDRLAQTTNATDRQSAEWARELSDLRQRIAEADLAVLAIQVDKQKLQRNLLSKQIEEMQALLARVLPNQKLSEDDLGSIRERMFAVGDQLTGELEKAQKRQQKHLEERQTLAKQTHLAGTEEALHLAFLDQALGTDAAVIEGLRGLEILIAMTNDIWQKRYIALSSDDSEQKRQSIGSLSKIHQGLIGRKRLSNEQREAAAISIRDQETRLSNLKPDSSAFKREEAILELLQERAKIHDRLEYAANRLERQLTRWLDDFKAVDASTLDGRTEIWKEKLRSALRSFWQYELFVVEDSSEVDGRTVSIGYGVTVGKSIGALCLFVLGYWLFSRLVQLLQLMLIRRFGVNPQLASVLRRWLMILLAIGLIIFILNLARIPLSVFAFMGGALAIGLGFGTQTIIKNFISGIIILFERKIRVGDIIQLEGMTGHVTAVDLRATTVRGFDGVEALVPNSSFLESQVVNWTYSNQQIRRELRIGIAYGSDTREAEATILKIVAEHPKILITPSPEVYFEDFADSALLLVVIYWVELVGGTVARRVDSDVRHVIYQRLAEAGIGIPFPQRDIHLNLTQPVPVVLAKENR